MWHFLNIKIGRACLKIYQGKRSDVIDYYDKIKVQNASSRIGKNESDQRIMDDALLNKNPASLGLIKIKNIIYHMFMHENG